MTDSSFIPHFRIFLREIRLSCRIGIDPAENEVSQLLLTDVEITPVAKPESVSDGQKPEVDYAAVLARIREFAASKQHQLMEQFASEVADIILNEFAAAEVKVSCRKPTPFSDIAEAGVEVCKTRKE